MNFLFRVDVTGFWDFGSDVVVMAVLYPWIWIVLCSGLLENLLVAVLHGLGFRRTP